jgi:hypothetical protein
MLIVQKVGALMNEGLGIWIGFKLLRGAPAQALNKRKIPQSKRDVPSEMAFEPVLWFTGMRNFINVNRRLLKKVRGRI